MVDIQLVGGWPAWLDAFRGHIVSSEHQRYDTSQIISSAFNNPEQIAYIVCDLRTSCCTVA